MDLGTTTGVEIELWAIDNQGALCDGRHLAESHEQIQSEFVSSLLEVKTEPHRRQERLRQDLCETLQEAIDRAADADKQLVPLGTPLTPSSGRPATRRGRLFEKIYGDGIAGAKNCAGTHIHFEQENVTRQLNLLTALDPALALVSSSPYYLGKRGADCSRAVAYRRECGSQFRQFCGLWGYTDSAEAWTDRVDAAFAAYKSLAVERGIPSSAVEEHFSPDDTVLTPVRLRRAQPTVEWRAPDAALPGQVLKLASDIGQLVGQTATKRLEFGPPGVHHDRLTVPEFASLYQTSTDAMWRGLHSPRVRSYLRRFRLRPEEYHPISSQLDGPNRLSENAARTLRLEHADRLRSDVETLLSASVNESDPNERRNQV